MLRLSETNNNNNYLLCVPSSSRYCFCLIRLLLFPFPSVGNSCSSSLVLFPFSSVRDSCLSSTFRGGWIIFHFSIVQVHFFCLLNFIVLFPYLIKYYHIIIIIILIWLGSDRLVETFFSWQLSFFPYSRLSSYLLRLILHLILSVFPMQECSGKHSCMSSPFPIAILNVILFYRETRW